MKENCWIKPVFFLLIVLSIEIEFSFSEETIVKSAILSSNDSNSDKAFKDTFNDAQILIIKYLKVLDTFKKRKLTVPKPIPNVLEMINNFKSIKSVRENLQSTFPAFWKVTKRQECAKVLDEKIQEYVEKFDTDVEHAFYTLMTDYEKKLYVTNKRLTNMTDSLRYNQLVYLVNCANDNSQCKKGLELLDPIKNDIKFVENSLNNLDKNFKQNFETWVTYDVNQKIIPLVNECVDS